MVCVNVSSELILALCKGPPESARDDSTSVKVIRDLMNGTFKDGAPPMQLPVCCLDDVVEAHVLAAENPKANYRFGSLCNPSLHLSGPAHFHAAL